MRFKRYSMAGSYGAVNTMCLFEFTVTLLEDLNCGLNVWYEGRNWCLIGRYFREEVCANDTRCCFVVISIWYDQNGYEF